MWITGDRQYLLMPIQHNWMGKDKYDTIGTCNRCGMTNQKLKVFNKEFLCVGHGHDTEVSNKHAETELKKNEDSLAEFRKWVSLS